MDKPSKSQNYYFLVKGSQPEPYQLEAERKDDKFTFSCSCAAGIMNQFCKHREALLQGDVTALVGGDTDKVAVLKDMLSGSEAAEARESYLAAEREIEAWRKRAAAEKRRLGRLLG